MQPLEGHHRRHARARDRRAVRDAPARRPRRPRHQDRAPRRRRLRPRLRRARARPGVALRLDQPLQGKPDARRQAPRSRRRSSSAWCIEKADVVVQNLAPGAAARLGLATTTLVGGEARRSSSATSPATATTGPYRDKKAYDLLIQSEAGLRLGHRHARRAVQGRPVDRRHRRRHVRVHATSSRRCCSAARPGSGQHIDISMLESLAEWTSYPLYYAFDGAPPPPRTGASHATIYPYGPFPAGDGKTVMLGLQNEREWVSFCDKVLQQPELAQRPALRRQLQARGRARRRCARSSSRPSRR